MKASVIISVSSSKVIFDNFLFNLSTYDGIENYEIIFINDDAEFSFDQNYISKVINTTIIVVESSKKLGYGAANNKAVDYSSSNILIFMNDDIILTPNCLEILIDDILSKRADAVQPKLIYPQSNNVQSTGHVFTQYSNAHALENNSALSNIVNTSGNRTALTTALCATRKDLFLLMGKFDLSYYNAWEGMEYTLKLTINGYKCLYDHRAEAYHIRGGARNQYQLDEDYQSAFFWSRWSSMIEEDLSKIISSQLDEVNSGNYLLLNFSKIPDIKQIIIKCGFNIEESISYTYNSGAKNIDFFKCMPIKLIQADINFIYFANNYFQIKNNSLWYKTRNGHHDLIMDLSGNVIKLY